MNDVISNMIKYNAFGKRVRMQQYKIKQIPGWGNTCSVTVKHNNAIIIQACSSLYLTGWMNIINGWILSGSIKSKSIFNCCWYCFVIVQDILTSQKTVRWSCSFLRWLLNKRFMHVWQFISYECSYQTIHRNERVTPHICEISNSLSMLLTLQINP